MQQEMKLRCTVGRLDDTGRYSITAKMFDGTSFTIKVYEYELERCEEFKLNREVVDGWVYVLQEGRQGEKVSVTLPQSSDQFGKNVTVNKLQLMPRQANIKMFNPQIVKTSKTPKAKK